LIWEVEIFVSFLINEISIIWQNTCMCVCMNACICIICQYNIYPSLASLVYYSCVHFTNFKIYLFFFFLLPKIILLLAGKSLVNWNGFRRDECMKHLLTSVDQLMEWVVGNELSFDSYFPKFECIATANSVMLFCARQNR